MTITPATRRELHQLLMDVVALGAEPYEAPDLGEVARRATALLPQVADRRAPKKNLAGESRTGKRRRKRTEESAARREMRRAVWAKNLLLTASLPTSDRPAAVEPGIRSPHGRCDCDCGYVFRHQDDGECDHWVEQSQGGDDTAENGWRLSERCHAEKTANDPDRATWNRKRRSYCERAGVPFVERRERSIGRRS